MEALLYSGSAGRLEKGEASGKKRRKMNEERQEPRPNKRQRGTFFAING